MYLVHDGPPCVIIWCGSSEDPPPIPYSIPSHNRGTNLQDQVYTTQIIKYLAKQIKCSFQLIIDSKQIRIALTCNWKGKTNTYFD